MDKVSIVAGSSHQELATDIAKKLGQNLTNWKLDKFANGELLVQCQDNLRCKHIYIIQTGVTNDTHSINDYLVELLLIINTCKLADSKKITVVLPYLPYCRSDKKDAPRVPIGASMLLSTLKNLGVNRVISMDLHASQIQGFFTNSPYDNIYAIKLFCNYLKENHFKNMTQEEINNNYVLISPDNGGIKRVLAYAERLGIDYNTMNKRRDYVNKNTVLSSHMDGGGENVKGKVAIVIDDMADTMGTMIATMSDFEKFGVRKVIVMVTHGILSGPAIERINNCEMIDEVVVTNTLPQTKKQEICSKLKVVDVSSIFAETIRCCIDKRSVSDLFK